MAVHHVDVDDARTGAQHLPHLLPQRAEIGGEDRGRDAYRAQGVRCAMPRFSHTTARTNQPPGAAQEESLRCPRVHIAINMLSPQLLHLRIAVEDMRTIVECSPQFGHTEDSSKRCRQ